MHCTILQCLCNTQAVLMQCPLSFAAAERRVMEIKEAFPCKRAAGSESSECCEGSHLGVWVTSCGD